MVDPETFAGFYEAFNQVRMEKKCPSLVSSFTVRVFNFCLFVCSFVSFILSLLGGALLVEFVEGGGESEQRSQEYCW